jgi:hypothetical protein
VRLLAKFFEYFLCEGTPHGYFIGDFGRVRGFCHWSNIEFNKSSNSSFSDLLRVFGHEHTIIECVIDHVLTIYSNSILVIKVYIFAAYVIGHE